MNYGGMNTMNPGMNNMNRGMMNPGMGMNNTMNPGMNTMNSGMGMMGNTGGFGASMNNTLNGTNNTLGGMNGMNNTMGGMGNMNNTMGGMGTMGMGMGMGMSGMNNTMGSMSLGNNMMTPMGQNPLGLTATSGGGGVGGGSRASSVDGLVDQTYLQLSGEASQITQKWRELQYEATDLQKKKVDLRRQWSEHLRNVATLEDEKRRFKEVSQAGFTPKSSELRVRLNVGGQMFETTASTLTRDPGSMLDALCRDDSPLAQLNSSQKTDDDEGKKEQDAAAAEIDSTNTVGVVFIDRDGKLFSLVLNFLRDGVLPQDKTILRSLYREAKYYDIKSLCVEIEKRLGIVAVSFFFFSFLFFSSFFSSQCSLFFLPPSLS